MHTPTQTNTHKYVCYVSIAVSKCVIIFFNIDAGNEVIANWQEKSILSYFIWICGEFASLSVK